MKRDRHDYIEVALAKSFIVQRRVEPTRYKMAEMNLATVFKFVDDLANDTATAVCGYGCVEVNRAMGTVGTGKSIGDRTLERFRAFLAKWRDDADGFCFASMAKVLASSNAFPADCATRRVQKRYGRLQQFKLLKDDHLSASFALQSK
jgi:hypothetical protein